MTLKTAEILRVIERLPDPNNYPNEIYRVPIFVLDIRDIIEARNAPMPLTSSYHLNRQEVLWVFKKVRSSLGYEWAIDI
jgi:hypothetical protein